MARLIKKTIKRKSIKRKSIKCKTIKRKVTKRKSIKRKIKKTRSIKKVQKRKYKGGGKWLNHQNPGVLENTLCPICLAEFEDTPNQAIYQTECGHIFHNDCLSAVCDLMQWRCPICRQSLTEADCTDVYAFKEKILGDYGFNDPEIRKIYDATF